MILLAARSETYGTHLSSPLQKGPSEVRSPFSDLNYSIGLTERRLDHARRICVHGDPVFTIIHRGGLRHAPDGELCRTIHSAHGHSYQKESKVNKGARFVSIPSKEGQHVMNF